MAKGGRRRQTGGAAVEVPQSVGGTQIPGQLTLPPGALEVALGRLRQARQARLIADRWEVETVAEARGAGLSWDRIGDALEASGESLRRRHGGRARDQ